MEKEVFDEIARRLIIASSVCYITMLIFLSILTDTTISLVFIGTSPFLCYIISFFALYLYHQAHKPLVWTLPLFFPMILLLFWLSRSVEVISSMEGPTVFVINVVLCYAINVIFFFLSKERTVRHEKKQGQELKHYQQWAQYYHDKAKYHLNEAHELRKQLSEYQNAIQVNQQNFRVQLRSIEDKCKALNFAIGRVYSDKNGGNEDIRAKIKINRELYNNFSAITADFKKEDTSMLMELLTKLSHNLFLLEQTEQKLFGTKVHTKSDGHQRVIDLLNQFDKDPVIEYYIEAREICTNMIEYMKKL